MGWKDQMLLACWLVVAAVRVVDLCTNGFHADVLLFGDAMLLFYGCVFANHVMVSSTVRGFLQDKGLLQSQEEHIS